jgi:hypothetical protein
VSFRKSSNPCKHENIDVETMMMTFCELTGQCFCLNCFIVVYFLGIEACPVNKRDLNALEFPNNRIFLKMFCTTSLTVVNECQSQFNFSSVRTIINNRKLKFLQKFAASKNSICRVFEVNAKQELVKLKSSITK